MSLHLPARLTEPRIQRVAVLLALLMGSTDQQGRRLRYPNAYAVEILDGGHFARPPLLARET